MQTTQRTTRGGLVRRPQGRWIAGVAGGLADATGTTAVWWRLGFIILALVGGAGIAIYLILWIVIPRGDLPRSFGERIADRLPGLPSWVGVTLLGLGMVLLLGRFWPDGLIPLSVRPPFAHQIRTASPGFALAVLLIGAGILLFRREEEREPATGWAPVAEMDERTDDLSPPPSAPGFRPRRPPRERSVTGWLSFGIALSASGVVWLLLNTGAVSLSLAQMLALPLAILGLGLLVGSLFGRARWTILLGLLLVPLVLASSLIPTPIVGRYDERYVRPLAAIDVRRDYQQAGGKLVFDFTKLRPGDRPLPVHAVLGVGDIEVIVAKGTPIDITASVGIGTITMLGDPIQGIGISDSLRRAGADPIVMTLESGIGSVSFFYEAPPRKPKPRPKRGGNG